MGLQKYRCDIVESARPNGSIPSYAIWMNGPTLSRIQACPTADPNMPLRTVYITSEPETYTSQPAACSFKGKTVRGYVTCDETGFMFHPTTKVCS